MAAYQIVRKPHMNRVYITGDTGSIRSLLSDFHARHDSSGAWLPLYQEGRLRSALAAEADYQTDRAAQLVAWEAAKSVIPSDYKTRHGAMYGGVVSFDGESIDEPGITAPKVPWVHIATWQERVRDLSGDSTINGHVMDSDALYSAVTEDGRSIYRIAHNRGFGDDLRETYYLPPDLWAHMMAAEVRARGITQTQAREWLEKYGHCVGYELYEFAASAALTSTEPIAIA